MDYTVATEFFENLWIPWGLVWAQTAEWPGDDNPSEMVTRGGIIWNMTVALLGKLIEHIEEVTVRQCDNVPGFLAHWAEKMALEGAATPLHHALTYAQSLPAEPAFHPVGARLKILPWLDVFVRLFQDVIDVFSELFQSCQPLRRLNIVLDFGLAALRGILEDDLVANGFESIDGQEFRSWLAAHGSRRPISPITVAFYDACFAYPQGASSWDALNMAAGTMLHGMMRLVFTYRKSIMLWMNAGMGDTIFTPCYLALKHRGVKFEFFQKVTNLGLAPDGRSVDTIDIDVQATLKDPAAGYQPLVLVNQVYSWPNRPFYEQLEQGDAIRGTAINNNLESWWTAWKPVAHKTLRRGQDFDLVVNAISLGALPYIASELIAANPQWRAMVEEVKTVRTQAFQLWLHKTASELGWNPGSPEPQVLDGFVEPFDTWANLSHLIPRESWAPDDRCRSIAYFCNAAPEDPQAQPFSDPAYPDTQKEKVRTAADQFLSQSMRTLWPNSAGDGGQFDRSLLASEFYRINVDPTERYVLSVAGSTGARLHSGDSGFENLFLAGDWTRVDLNLGCVEAAVQSGMTASRAICGSPQYFYDAFGMKVPIVD
jgi:uncharacterized protein with NAD-binding domain and iron-sulfur cluster